MQVRITNVTDGPGKKPKEVRVHTNRLRPGQFMDVPVQFVDDKVRKLEQSGAIVIGKLPPWYSDTESRRKVRNLTLEEVTANVEVKKDHQRLLAARKADKEASAKEAPPMQKTYIEETAQTEPAPEAAEEAPQKSIKEDGRGSRQRR